MYVRGNPNQEPRTAYTHAEDSLCSELLLELSHVDTEVYLVNIPCTQDLLSCRLVVVF